ncbi:MAG: trigger factor [Patescibacteria group bacterium]|jgi:trigger factor
MSDEFRIQVKNHKTHKHSRHEFEVEVPAVTMGEFFERAYRQLAPTVEIKGFRRGQAPKVLTIQRIGNERYFGLALDMALPATYAEAVKLADVHPIAPPEVAIQSYGEGAALTYKVVVDVIPEIELGDYQKLKVKAPKKDDELTAREVDEVIDRLRKQQAVVTPVDRPAAKGDRVEIDYAGHVKNVKRDDLSSQHFPLVLGEGVFVAKKLEAALEGKKKGDVFEVEDKVEKDTVRFEVSVHEVAEVKLPDVDTAFAEQFGRKDADDLREAVKSQLRMEKETAHRRELEDLVLGEVLKKAKLELPESLIEEEIGRRIGEVKQQLGVMFPKFLESQKKSEDDIRKELRPSAEHSVKAGLVLGEIAKREGFGEDRHKGEPEIEFQKRVVRRTLSYLVAIATGTKPDEAKAGK